MAAAPILGLDDDVLRIFGEKVEEESGIVAVAALACSCHMFHALLQPRASAFKAASLAALCTRLGEDDLDKVSRARWRGRGLTDVDLALIASDWLRPKGRLQGLVALDMRKADPGEGGDGTSPNSFGVRGVRALAAALPHLDSLTSLTLEQGGEVPSALLQSTAPSTINLSSPGPLTACMVGLLAARNPKLKRLKLGDSGNEHLPVRELCGNAPSCQKLDFSSGLWRLGKLSGLAIGAMLSTNATLVYLDLSHNFSPGMQCTRSSAHAAACSVHAEYMQPDASRPFAPLLTRAGPRSRVGLLPGPRASHRGLAAHAQASLLRRSTLSVPLLQQPMRPTPPLQKPTCLLRAALGPRGPSLLLGCQREAALLPAQSRRFHRPSPPRRTVRRGRRRARQRATHHQGAQSVSE